MPQLVDTVSDAFVDENSFDGITSDGPEKMPPFINTVLAINTIYKLSFLKLAVKRISFGSKLLLKNTLSRRSVFVHKHSFEIL